MTSIKKFVSQQNILTKTLFLTTCGLHFINKIPYKPRYTFTFFIFYISWLIKKNPFFIGRSILMVFHPGTFLSLLVKYLFPTYAVM